jgi:hemerythrin superfamily protein
MKSDPHGHGPRGDDAVTLLTAQHRRLEALLKALVDSDDGCERSTLLSRAGDELAVHIAAEEQVFYPAVRAVRTEDILLESLEEHLSLKRLLADLLELAPGGETFAPKCKVLEEQARHHHEEEEEHLFPAVRRLMDADALQQLGLSVREHEAGLQAAGDPREDVRRQTDAAAPLT